MTVQKKTVTVSKKKKYSVTSINDKAFLIGKSSAEDQLKEKKHIK